MKQKVNLAEDSSITKPDFDPEFQKFLREVARRRKFREYSKIFAKKFLKSLALTSAVCLAATSPFFITNLFRALTRSGFYEAKGKERKQMSDMFTYLRRKGLIRIVRTGAQIYISLTTEGKKKAKEFQIDDLNIEHPKIWDNKWRILIFDIPEITRIKREALRGKLKELGFSMLQKSVWVHPYPCNKELEILRDFFGFKEVDYLFFETRFLGKEERNLRKKFELYDVGL